MPLSATVQQVRRAFPSSVQPQPRCLRTIYELFMRASCWLISNSYEEATVTVARPVHEVANDCDHGFKVDRSQAIRFVSVLASSVMPAGLAISIRKALNAWKRFATWLIPKQGEQFDLYVESERDLR
jgi:hypothetical protein